jgi:hypothetical protein
MFDPYSSREHVHLEIKEQKPQYPASFARSIAITNDSTALNAKSGIDMNMIEKIKMRRLRQLELRDES